MIGLLPAVAACSGDGFDDVTPGAAPSTSASTTTSTIQEFVPTPIAWQPCEDDLECAEVTVPVDYGQPAGPTLVLSVQRAPASGQRIGAVFVNPGGPGGATADFVPYLKDNLPPTVTEQFDLVGVEWRGTAASDFGCGVAIPELYAVDHTIDDPADAAALIDVSRRYTDGCLAGAGELLAHIGTRDAARDLDIVRAAMGDEQMPTQDAIALFQVISQRYLRGRPQLRWVDLSGPLGAWTGSRCRPQSGSQTERRLPSADLRIRGLAQSTWTVQRLRSLAGRPTPTTTGSSTACPSCSRRWRSWPSPYGQSQITQHGRVNAKLAQRFAPCLVLLTHDA
jgi:hypothetical protein